MAYDVVMFLERLFGDSPGTPVADGVDIVRQDLEPNRLFGPDDLTSEWRIEWEERAAIREYDGGQAREHAEAEAFGEILERMRAAGVIDDTPIKDSRYPH